MTSFWINYKILTIWLTNYFLNRKGDIISLIPDDSYSNIFTDNDINKNSIVICLENLGWLKKTPLGMSYSNWIGDIYSKDIFEKKWRDQIWWETYPLEQIDSLVGLSKKLLSKFNKKGGFKALKLTQKFCNCILIIIFLHKILSER